MNPIIYDSKTDTLTENFAVISYVKYLKSKGWKDIHYCLGHQRGLDIIASKDNKKIIVEAKGARGDQSKNQTVRSMFSNSQIKDHLGKAIVKILELRIKNPNAQLVILHTHTQDIRKIVDPVGKQLKHSFKIKFSFVKECGSIVNL